MSNILTVVQQKPVVELKSPVPIQDTSIMDALVKNLQKSEDVSVPSDENYFNLFDNSFSFFDNSDEPQKDENYESFDNNILLDISKKPRSYQLEESFVDENTFIESTRFFDDIIFILNHTRVFESSALILTAGIIASLFLLPDDFNVSISLLLSAPLVVSICGLYMKYIKKKT